MWQKINSSVQRACMLKMKHYYELTNVQFEQDKQTIGEGLHRPNNSKPNAFVTRRFCHFCKQKPAPARQREHVTRSLIFLCHRFSIVIEADCILRLMQRSDRLTHLPQRGLRRRPLRRGPRRLRGPRRRQLPRNPGALRAEFVALLAVLVDHPRQ